MFLARTIRREICTHLLLVGLCPLAVSIVKEASRTYRRIGTRSVNVTMSKRSAEDVAPESKRRPPIQGLKQAMNVEGSQVYADDTCVAIADKYPKARHHWLVLPREDIPTIKSLRAHHLPVLEHLEKIGRQLISDNGLAETDFRLGYHAVPSMAQLHLHVISQDFDSSSLKTKKHWNSFTTAYFVDSAIVIKDIRKNGSFTVVEPRIAEVLLKKDLKCHRCEYKPSTIPKLKEHIKTHL